MQGLLSVCEPCNLRIPVKSIQTTPVLKKCMLVVVI